MGTLEREPLSLSEDLRARVEQRILEADAWSVSSISTNSTASDVIGPGRTLGMAYKFAGKRLEASLNKCFEKAGFGPHAASRRIQRRMSPLGASSRGGSSAVVEAMGRMHKYMMRRDCIKLLAYTQCVYLFPSPRLGCQSNEPMRMLGPTFSQISCKHWTKLSICHLNTTTFENF